MIMSDELRLVVQAVVMGEVGATILETEHLMVAVAAEGLPAFAKVVGSIDVGLIG
jgi:hypothetical protein